MPVVVLVHKFLNTLAIQLMVLLYSVVPHIVVLKFQSYISWMCCMYLADIITYSRSPNVMLPCTAVEAIIMFSDYTCKTMTV